MSNSFKLPWSSETYWLSHSTGIATNVKVDKIVKHSMVSVPGNVAPHLSLSSHTEVESSFWLTSENSEQSHYSFNFAITPILDGQRVSVIWGAGTGIESGKYKCIYNHTTNMGCGIPGNYWDFGIEYQPDAGYKLCDGLAKISILFCILSGLSMFGNRDNSYVSIFMVCMLITYLLISASVRKKAKHRVMIKRLTQMNNTIIEYAKSL